jgi:hypothetical protein
MKAILVLDRAAGVAAMQEWPADFTLYCRTANVFFYRARKKA